MSQQAHANQNALSELSLDAIVNLLRANGMRITRNRVQILETLHIAQKVNLNRSCSYYELVNPKRHYDHIICTECGRVTLIVDSCPVEKVERKIEKRYGYSDIRHSLEYFGKCRECT